MTKILVYRFSAMGDVILLLPVLKGVLAANNDLEIYLLTQPNFFSIFRGIDRLHLVEADLKGHNNGFKGLFRLFKSLESTIKPDIVIDLHCVLRSYILDFFFRINGFRVINFRKGTFKKHQLIRTKLLNPLPNTIDRYAEAFLSAGFPVSLPEPPLFSPSILQVPFSDLLKKPVWIGVAPFAKHAPKIWGIKKIESLLVELGKVHDANIILFGGGKSELDTLNLLAAKYANCIVSANHYKFHEEIDLITQLDVMISMDSANMHIASMAGIPTVSIWGATHPALGFAPYKQPAENIIQYPGDQLNCRPCSVYGNKKCIFSDGIRCMDLIPVDAVLSRVNLILGNSKG